jgi:hypothetical protein
MMEVNEHDAIVNIYHKITADTTDFVISKGPEYEEDIVPSFLAAIYR